LGVGVARRRLSSNARLVTARPKEKVPRVPESKERGIQAMQKVQSKRPKVSSPKVQGNPRTIRRSPRRAKSPRR
jgi:hypothetical protein